MATMETVIEGKVVIQVINEYKLTMVIILSASSLATSLVAILVSMLVLALLLKKEKSKLKPKSGKKELPKMEEFTTRIKIFHTYTSPIYNPYFSEEKDDM